MPPSTTNAAFVFVAANYDTSGEALVGRHVASEEFLRGFVRHGGVDRFLCYAHNQAEYETFTRRIAEFRDDPGETELIKPTEMARLAEVGTLFRPGPGIGHYAWLRRQFDQRGFSLCGVTHTTADSLAMDALGGLVTAPLQAWDALVCPTEAVKAMVERLLADWCDYLGERFAGRAERSFQLPVIPLGVDCDRFAPSPEAEGARAELRQRHGIGDDDVAVLYVGRLNHIDKANPLPLYIALEEATKRSGRRFHFIQAGWFPNAYTEEAFREGATALAPSVNTIFVDGRAPEHRTRIWFAADIFASLPDSVQETFGQTPVEAMAACLPAVVADWNGYRETVRDGVDGITVPTVMPAAGLGRELAFYYASDITNYDGYSLSTNQAIAVDVEAATEAFVRLAGDADMRRRMGEAGQRRAREVYDWPVVIAAYQALWEELAEIRRDSAEAAVLPDGAPSNPLRADPYALFAGYPTTHLDDESTIGLVPGADRARLEVLRQTTLANPLPALLLPEEDLLALFEHIATGPKSMGDLLDAMGEGRRALLFRTVGWLAKTGLARIDGGEGT